MVFAKLLADLEEASLDLLFYARVELLLHVLDFELLALKLLERLVVVLPGQLVLVNRFARLRVGSLRMNGREPWLRFCGLWLRHIFLCFSFARRLEMVARVFVCDLSASDIRGFMQERQSCRLLGSPLTEGPGPTAPGFGSQGERALLIFGPVRLDCLGTAGGLVQQNCFLGFARLVVQGLCLFMALLRQDAALVGLLLNG